MICPACVFAESRIGIIPVPVPKSSTRSPVFAFAKEDISGSIVQVALAEVDGVKIKADTWYGVDLMEREVELL